MNAFEKFLSVHRLFQKSGSPLTYGLITNRIITVRSHEYDGEPAAERDEFPL